MTGKNKTYTSSALLKKKPVIWGLLVLIFLLSSCMSITRERIDAGLTKETVNLESLSWGTVEITDKSGFSMDTQEIKEFTEVILLNKGIVLSDDPNEHTLDLIISERTYERDLTRSTAIVAKLQIRDSQNMVWARIIFNREGAASLGSGYELYDILERTILRLSEELEKRKP